MDFIASDMKTGRPRHQLWFPGGQRGLYSSIGAVCEGNTDTIIARQVSVGLISGGLNNFLGGKTYRDRPGDGAVSLLHSVGAYLRPRLTLDW